MSPVSWNLSDVKLSFIKLRIPHLHDHELWYVYSPRSRGQFSKGYFMLCPGLVLSPSMVCYLHPPDTSRCETSQLPLAELLHEILLIWPCTDGSKPYLYPACVFQMIFALFCCTAMWNSSDRLKKKIMPHTVFMLWQGAGKLFQEGGEQRGSLDICYSLKLLFLTQRRRLLLPLCVFF